MAYIPNTDNDKKEMLKAIGIASGDIEELFKNIPKALRANSFNLPSRKSEFETVEYFRRLAGKNKTDLVTFMGGGFYDHYIPAAVDAIASRSEFYTAYTPYQPEASQGTLQAIYEFQSCMCRLTGMEVSNASLYDGGTALFEACMMAVRATGRNKILIDDGVNPIYRRMLYSYTSNLSIEFVEVPVIGGRIDRGHVLKELDDKTAAFVFQNPNFFGAVDDYADLVGKCHDKGALAIQNVYPVSLGLLKTPGEMGVDIVVGEGQSLGLPLAFGGPYLGFMGVTKKFARKIPGRISGATQDHEGRKGFVLTLQTREQHIRREKATSNICSNEALCALRSLVYMCLLGRDGLVELAQVCINKAEYAKEKLSKIKGIEINKAVPTFNEFQIKLPVKATTVIDKMVEKGFEAGIPLGRYYKGMDNDMLVTVTEKRTKEEIDSFAGALEEVVCS